jgi:hypothetical protein
VQNIANLSISTVGATFERNRTVVSSVDGGWGGITHASGFVVPFAELLIDVPWRGEVFNALLFRCGLDVELYSILLYTLGPLSAATVLGVMVLSVHIGEAVEAVNLVVLRHLGMPDKDTVWWVDLAGRVMNSAQILESFCVVCS